MLRVWVDSWQVQCCGTAFGVGDVVTWTLVETDADPRGLGTTHHEEHHGGVPDDAPETTGTVTRVRAVFSEYAPLDPAQPRTLHSVPGSTTTQERRARVDGWEPESGPRFDGYVVDLDTAAQEQ